MPLLSNDQYFHFYTWNQRWSNASLIRRRHFDGHIVSMKQSGTHWLKNMLSHIMIELYDLPPMAHIQDDSIIGHTKSPPVYKNIPQIVHSHGHPHGLTLRVPFIHFPRYLLLMRDLRDGLVSHYERFKDDYGVSDFPTYLYGDIRQKKFRSDIYSRIRYMNEWGDMLHKKPAHTALALYETLQKETVPEMLRICRFFQIPNVDAAVVERAIEATTREKMAKKPNPEVGTVVVRTEHKKTTDEYFTPELQNFLEETCRKYLRHNFGYNYPTVTA
jgi:hypothetical protein